MTIETTAPPAVAAATVPFVLPEAPPELRASLEAGKAIAWYEPVEIPTYEPQDASTFPMYLDQRVYQGSSGRVYPLPFTERIDSAPSTHRWNAVHIENRYIRVMILPELGGRIHVAYDKTTDYDFFYRNNVIKPALVGLAGAWMSGGVEFNWPQHHRPATFLPVESTIESHDDGSVTVWCSDHDPFARMRGTHGIHLSPDSSTIRLDVRLHNRTSLPQTFLWWANVAVRVHDDYQSFFPEDVRYVADHARRAITAFPQADRPYYGVDYQKRARTNPGADRLDYYRNIPVPTSYMVVDTEHEFFGGFDHSVGAGFVHWADRRIAPGKKQWTWGSAPFGQAWDRLLTDSDGPYVELMAGVYTDNQPDFSWLAPGESKRFSQYWYPIPDIGVAHEASPDAAIHVERASVFSAAVAVTSPRPGARLVVLSPAGEQVCESSADLVPGVPWRVEFPVSYEAGMTVALGDAQGTPLVEWRAPVEVEGSPEPWTATAPPAPADVASVDELFYIGQHLVQYRHPSRSPLPYWTEAIRRDPADSRVLTALAELAFRAAEYDAAREYAGRALARVTGRNGNPRHAETLYLLGLIESRRGNVVSANAAFAKASWDGTFVAPAGLEMARQYAREGRFDAALHDLDELDAVAADDRRRGPLRVILLRRLGREVEATASLARLQHEEPLNPTLAYLASGDLPSDGHLALDVALELAQAGEDESALEVLAAAAVIGPSGSGNVGPVAHYHRAAILDRRGRPAEAAAERATARSIDRRWCFPAGLDDHDALLAAVRAEDDPVAASLLGMLLFDVGRRDDALALWEAAIRAGDPDPLLLRNAGLASYTVAHDDARAVEYYERAIDLDPDDPRLLFERDLLAARLGETDAQRLERLAQRFGVVAERDDLVVEYAELLVRTGQPDAALALLEDRSFQPWEGGEGRVLGAWDHARAALGLPIADPPLSLGEGRPLYEAPVARGADGEIDYFATSLPDLLLFSRA
jgi:tetratricopeptide (TPR) repeat protein